MQQRRNQEKNMPKNIQPPPAFSERLKRLGFANASRMKLYGEELELLSDPIVAEDSGVYVDAIERKSRQPRRVRIPLTIVNMASERKAA
jgi:hypothetical protein